VIAVAIFEREAKSVIRDYKVRRSEFGLPLGAAMQTPAG
jgi:hypothetical protein